MTPTSMALSQWRQVRLWLLLLWAWVRPALDVIGCRQLDLSLAAGGSTMEGIIKRLGQAELQPMEASNFVKPLSVFYELDGEAMHLCLAA